MDNKYYDEAYRFIKEHYRPVEDQPGYVWLNIHTMEIISVDILAKSIVNYLAIWDKEKIESEEKKCLD